MSTAPTPQHEQDSNVPLGVGASFLLFLGTLPKGLDTSARQGFITCCVLTYAVPVPQKDFNENTALSNGNGQVERVVDNEERDNNWTLVVGADIPVRSTTMIWY